MDTIWINIPVVSFANMNIAGSTMKVFAFSLNSEWQSIKVSLLHVILDANIVIWTILKFVFSALRNIGLMESHALDVD